MAKDKKPEGRRKGTPNKRMQTVTDKLEALVVEAHYGVST